MMNRLPVRCLCILLWMNACGSPPEVTVPSPPPVDDAPPAPIPALTAQRAAPFVQLALHCIDTEFPNKPGQVLAGAGEVATPRELHPAFYGCFDWHSAVHGHWALVRQLREVPELAVAAEVRQRLDEHLAAEPLAAELAYQRQPHHRTFERPYGWAWLLRLVAELEAWDDVDGNRWRENLRPLEGEIVGLMRAYLPVQNYPVRVGTHTNTAFALTHMLDYARTVGDAEFEQQIVARSREYYLADRDCPAAYEPSGTDFLSPCLEEADLMRRVLPPEEFAPWLEAFFPDPSDAAFGPLREPAEVLDLSDPYLIHLVGLNLSRAWCLRGIAGALPAQHGYRDGLLHSAGEHAQAGLALVSTGDYGGEHWLATYAVYLLTDVGMVP